MLRDTQEQVLGTTALPSGVTGFNIFGDNPVSVAHVWQQMANRAIKINGTQYAVMPAYVGTSPGNGILLKKLVARTESTVKVKLM